MTSTAIRLENHADPLSSKASFSKVGSQSGRYKGTFNDKGSRRRAVLSCLVSSFSLYGRWKKDVDSSVEAEMNDVYMLGNPFYIT